MVVRDRLARQAHARRTCRRPLFLHTETCQLLAYRRHEEFGIRHMTIVAQIPRTCAFDTSPPSRPPRAPHILRDFVMENREEPVKKERGRKKWELYGLHERL